MYVPLHDLDRPSVVSTLLRLIYRGKYYYIHFGMPCSSFSLLQNLNKGTRSTLRPQGDDSLEREKLGNRLAIVVCLLCRAQHDMGNFFSIENPRSSFLWKFGPVQELVELFDSVDFDQCMYGLEPPNSNFPQPQEPTPISKSNFPQPQEPTPTSKSKLRRTAGVFKTTASKSTSTVCLCKRIKKPTRVLTNLKCLNVLARKCDNHVACMGSVKTAFGWKSVAKEAGAYPLSLCKPWAAAVARSCRS